MKPAALAPEHKKFFQINGYISFEGLIPSREMEAVWKEMLERHKQLPEPAHENISRSVPSVLKLARKLGGVAAGLLDRKPVRFAYDSFVETLDQVRKIEEREIGLLLSDSGKGFFFNDRSHLYNLPQECYLLIVFTANYVNNPIVFND
ncbi:MAG: DUF5070 domain-containing protein [Chlamydiales bacterium]|nr:DUF5070 domain-containing protein [Chlamydiales bacterium]